MQALLREMFHDEEHVKQLKNERTELEHRKDSERLREALVEKIQMLQSKIDTQTNELQQQRKMIEAIMKSQNRIMELHEHPDVIMNDDSY
jgi:uncharacterized protein HemX